MPVATIYLLWKNAAAPHHCGIIQGTISFFQGDLIPPAVAPFRDSGLWKL